MDYVNETEIRVVGMSRSGNHALINWILKQASGRFCFLNCAEAKHNPFETARPLESGSCHVTNISGYDPSREAEGCFSNKDWLIHSYEDTFLKPLHSARSRMHRDIWVGRSRRRVDVLLLRDPYNLFASRLRYAHAGGMMLSPAEVRLHLRIWKQHARQFLGERSLFRGEWICVSYNDWIKNGRYRQALAKFLGLDFTDAGYSEVPGCAGGSSFDGLNFNAQAQQMDLERRWPYLNKWPSLIQVIDAQAHDLACRAFPAVAEAIQEQLMQASQRHLAIGCAVLSSLAGN